MSVVFIIDRLPDCFEHPVASKMMNTENNTLYLTINVILFILNILNFITYKYRILFSCVKNSTIDIYDNKKQ